jgi:hypothetical protein
MFSSMQIEGRGERIAFVVYNVVRNAMTMKETVAIPSTMMGVDYRRRGRHAESEKSIT